MADHALPSNPEESIYRGARALRAIADMLTAIGTHNAIENPGDIGVLIGLVADQVDRGCLEADHQHQRLVKLLWPNGRIAADGSFRRAVDG